jgi:hypothetical protein
VAKGTLTGIYEYRHGEDGLPILKRTVSKSRVPSEQVETESINEFDLREADVPEDDFALSAFDFPEPPGLARRRVPGALVAAVAGLVVLALGVVVRRLARRAGTAPRSA